MASKQIISYGATVERSTDGITYTSIPEVKGVAIPEVETDYQEVTNMDSPNGYREYIVGLLDAGEIEVPCGYTAAGFEQQLADQTTGRTVGAMYYKVTMKKQPDQAVVGDIFTYRGFPTPKLSPGDIGAPVEMTITIRVSGDFTWVRGS